MPRFTENRKYAEIFIVGKMTRLGKIRIDDQIYTHKDRLQDLK